MIELKNVSKFYNSNGTITVALRNINLKLSKGEIVAITGESGAGKSTLLNVICGVDSYEEGELYFKGQETSYFNQDDMDIYRKKNIGFIYQSYNIIDSYTVLENVMLPLILKGEKLEVAKEKALVYIEKVGLSHRIHNKGIKLSGGEKQRCVIARALASDFEILACDEPTGNLDSETGKQIIELIKEVAKDKLVLIVTHNYEQVEHIVTRTIKVSDAEIVQDIVKENITDDIVEELDLVETKNKLKSLGIVSTLNVKNTPKKTIFTSIVFMVFSFVMLFLLLTMLAWNDINKFTPNNQYYNTSSERIIVFNKDYSPIDISDFESFEEEVFENTFYEDIQLFLKVDRNNANMSIPTLFVSLTNHLPYDNVNVFGQAPVSENEGYIVFPTELVEDNSDRYSKYVNKDVYLGDYKNININLNLTGFGYSDSISKPIVVTKKDVHKLFYRSYLKNFDMYVTLGDKKVNVDYSLYGFEKPKLTYFYKEEVELKDLEIVLKGIYHIKVKDYEINFVQSEYEEHVIIDLPSDFSFDEIFEVTVYSDNFKTTLSKLDRMGYAYRLPGKNGVIIDSQESLYFMLFVLVSIIAIIILFFITYVIISKIAISKLKDYTILRSNGVLKGSMKNVIHFEMITLGVFGCVLSYVIFMILSLFIPIIQNIVYYNNAIVTFVYLILNIIFAYFISRRLNKKVFKNTIATSFKSEVMNNA